jgi:DNA-binding GntR family transcriptional regulator
VTLDSPATVLPETIYRSLRDGILEQRDAPGVALTESAVADRYGVARPTAKIAIERLVGEGLLRREAHRAARVPELDRDDVVDLFDNRAIVEGAAIESLARRGTVPSAAQEAQRALLERARDEAPFAELDIAFHRALVAGQPSPRLARMHDLLMGEIELCLAQVQAGRLLTAAAIGRQHQGILDAVAASDPDRAGRLAREHIIGSRDLLVAHYESAPSRTPRK